MTTPWPPRRTASRSLAPRVAAPQEPADPARIGRRVVRRPGGQQRLQYGEQLAGAGQVGVRGGEVGA
ncbi:hypothetical protein ABZ646_43225, partial [Streptomyces sp. NPDC007162]